MKLDRNTNPDGRGKYALINLRNNKIEWGGPGGEQFFVLKYKDRFTSAALYAYANAIDVAIASGKLTETQVNELAEFSEEIRREALAALEAGNSIPS